MRTLPDDHDLTPEELAMRESLLEVLTSEEKAARVLLGGLGGDRADSPASDQMSWERVMRTRLDALEGKGPKLGRGLLQILIAYHRESEVGALEDRALAARSSDPLVGALAMAYIDLRLLHLRERLRDLEDQLLEDQFGEEDAPAQNGNTDEYPAP